MEMVACQFTSNVSIPEVEFCYTDGKPSEQTGSASQHAVLLLETESKSQCKSRVKIKKRYILDLSVAQFGDTNLHVVHEERDGFGSGFAHYTLVDGGTALPADYSWIRQRYGRIYKRSLQSLSQILGGPRPKSVKKSKA